MIILGIDTSCEQASCALYQNGNVVERRSAPDKRKHSITLMPMVSEFLKEAELKVENIDLFAVSAGPGSFTGLRIGMAVIKGMAYAVKKQIAVIKTPDVLANYFTHDKMTVCPMIDARNNQVYTSLYQFKNGFQMPITDYVGIKIQDLAKQLKTYSNINICGDAAFKHYSYLIENGINCEKPNDDFMYPSTAVLVSMAAEGLGDIVEPKEAVPFYLRVSQAERFHG